MLWILYGWILYGCVCVSLICVIIDKINQNQIGHRSTYDHHVKITDDVPEPPKADPESPKAKDDPIKKFWMPPKAEEIRWTPPIVTPTETPKVAPKVEKIIPKAKDVIEKSSTYSGNIDTVRLYRQYPPYYLLRPGMLRIRHGYRCSEPMLQQYYYRGLHYIWCKPIWYTDRYRRS